MSGRGICNNEEIAEVEAYLDDNEKFSRQVFIEKFPFYNWSHTLALLFKS